MIQFIVKELKADKKFVPVLQGCFAHSPPLEEDQAAKWVATRTMDQAKEAGFDDEKLYDLATLMGGSTFKSELKSAVKSGKIRLESDNRRVANQVLKVIRLVVRYFTGEASSSDEEDEEPEEVKPLLTEANNPWNQMESEFMEEMEQSFDRVKDHLAKDLMRMGHFGGNGTSNPFEIANEMAKCFASIQHTLPSLRMLVVKHTDKVLPDPDSLDESFLYFDLLKRLKKVRPPTLPQELMEHCLRKTLKYIIRGEQHKSGNQGPQQTSNDIVLNYLPLGLREQEEVNAALKNKDLMAPEGVTISYDQDSNDLGPKKYLIGSVYLEWLVLDGKSHICEIHLHFPNISDLSLYVVNRELSQQKDLLNQFNFVLNPDKHKYFYVQTGSGCCEASSLKFSMKKLTSFLQQMRSSSGENQNNGLLLVFRGDEEIAMMVNLLEMTSSDALLQDVVKGFGSIQSLVNDKEDVAYGRPTPQEAYFQTTIQTGKETKTLTSKSKGESLYQALEALLGEPPSYKNFIQPYCIQSKGTAMHSLRSKFKSLEGFYKLEKYIASKASQTPKMCHNVCDDIRCRTMSSPLEVAAYRLSKLMLDFKVDMSGLMVKYQDNANYSFAEEFRARVKPRQRELLTKTLHGVIKSFFTEVI